ncbi:MAG: PA2928 family protein, partial [Rhodanobacteraceae bacterium]
MLAGCTSSTFDPPEREGAPALVRDAGTPRLWLATKQEEERMIHVRGGSRSIGSWKTVSYYHFAIEAHDPATIGRLWKRPLRTMNDDEGGHTAESRMLGQDGDVVWMFLADGPLALSSRDASVVADRIAIERANPELRDLVPRNLDYYAYDDGLVIVAADARRWRIRGAALHAEPYVAPSEDYFNTVHFMSTRWNGGYHTQDFLTRHATLGDRWLGFYSTREADDARDDGFGDNFAKPDAVRNEGPQARRTFWSASIGQTREFTEGRHDRLVALERVADAPEFLAAGWLKRAGMPDAFRVRDPDGVLVVHRTRLDEEGRLAITRIDETTLKSRWTATLPFQELRNKFELGDRLLLYGQITQTTKGVTRTGERIVSLNLTDGA